MFQLQNGFSVYPGFKADSVAFKQLRLRDSKEGLPVPTICCFLSKVCPPYLADQNHKSSISFY